MDVVANKSEILDNIGLLREYLRQPGLDRDFACDLVRNGRCFVVTEHSGNLCFAPSRFIGYRGNSRHEHCHNDRKHGTETNDAISAVLAMSPAPSSDLEDKYAKYCNSLGIQVRQTPPFGGHRTFWDLSHDAV